MTKLEKMRDELAKKCRLEGKPAFGKYQPGVSWDFCAGFDASTAYHAEIIGELVKALEFYAEFEISYKWEGIISPGTPFSKFIDIGKTEFISPARQALESVRGKL